MRLTASVLLGLLLLSGGVGDKKDEKGSENRSRYGIAVDLKSYPQATPREAFASVLKAIDGKRVDYLLAQLSDPQFVDERVARLYGGKFDQQVADTRAKLDSVAIKQLHRFQDQGEWTADDARAVVSLKDLPDRVVIFKLIGGRWYFENENKPAR